MTINRRDFVSSAAAGVFVGTGGKMAIQYNESKMAEISSRLRAFVLPDRYVVEMMACSGDSVVVPRYIGMPEGAHIFSIHYEWQRRGYVIILAHSSFDIVPPGSEIPMNGELVELKKYRIVSDDSVAREYRVIDEDEGTVKEL